ncbi:MAG: hypothetical protein RLY43_1081 [Bacteroidota bacterium]
MQFLNLTKSEVYYLTTFATKSEVAAAVGGLKGAEDTYAALAAIAPGVRGVGGWIVRNDETRVPANKGQLYINSGTAYTWVMTWPYAAGDIVNETVYTGGGFFTGGETDVQTLLDEIDTKLSSSTNTDRIPFLVDGESFTITSGQKTPYRIVPFNCTISGWAMRNSGIDTMTFDVEYANTIGGTPASICGGGTKPNTSAAASNSSTNVTGWTTTLVKGGVITVNCTIAPASAVWSTLTLYVTKTN